MALGWDLGISGEDSGSESKIVWNKKKKIEVSQEKNSNIVESTGQRSERDNTGGRRGGGLL